MKEVILDSEMLSTDFRDGNYDVSYALYYDSTPRRKNSIYIPKDLGTDLKAHKNSNHACFAGMRGMLQEYVNPGPYCKTHRLNIPMPNRVCYKMNFNTAGKPKLSKTERYAWLRICKKYKLLPSYVVPSTVITGQVVFDMHGISPSLLYFYLTMMRAIVEYPAFVKAMVYLSEKTEMNFYAAFVFASRIYISNYGHHVISPNEHYGSGTNSKDIANMKGIEFHLMSGLRKYTQDPRKYDKRPISELQNTYWKCSDTIRTICITKRSLTAPDLFKPSLTKAIEAETEAEIQKHLNEMEHEPDVRIILKNLNVKQKIKAK